MAYIREDLGIDKKLCDFLQELFFKGDIIKEDTSPDQLLEIVTRTQFCFELINM